MYNNPLLFTDPTGAAPDDWYRNNETGEVHWQEGSEEVNGHTNMGSEYILEGTKDFIVHDQNDVVATIAKSSLASSSSVNSNSPFEIPQLLTSGGSFTAAAATGLSAYNVTGGKYRGTSGNYYSHNGRQGWNQYTGTKNHMNNTLKTARMASRLNVGIGLLNYGAIGYQRSTGQINCINRSNVCHQIRSKLCQAYRSKLCHFGRSLPEQRVPLFELCRSNVCQK